MLITILTEGSIDWGIGHICRCLAFYDAFLNEGFDVRFLSNVRESYLLNILIPKLLNVSTTFHRNYHVLSPLSRP